VIGLGEDVDCFGDFSFSRSFSNIA
jgi:hypothetical protein